MKRYLTTAIVGIVCFVLGVAFQRYSDARRVPAQPPADSTVATKPEPPAPVIQYDREPLWAYGFETVAKADDKAPPQAAPTRNLRPNEDPEEQTRARQARGSRASYSLVDVRDGHNVIDWFPQDHPSPMPPIIKTRPGRRHGQHGARMRLVPSSQRQRTSGERATCRTTGRVLHAPASGFQERAAPTRPTLASRTPTR